MAKKRPPKLNRNEAGVEFRLLVERFSSDLPKRSGVAFLFRTSEQFQNFVYELVVESKRVEQKIYFNIMGLRTPMLDFPRPGPAVCRCEFEDLEEGEYTLVIDRRGKQVNQFKISLDKEPKLLRSNQEDKFIEVLTDRSEWGLLGD